MELKQCDRNTNSFTLRRKFTKMLDDIPTSILFLTIFNENYTDMKLKTVCIKDIVHIRYYDYHSEFHDDVFEITTNATLDKLEENYQLIADFESINIYDEANLAQSIVDNILESYTEYKANI